MHRYTTDGICKVYFTCDDHQRLLVLEEALNARWGDRVNVSFSLPVCLEVMAGGVSKGHALRQVADLLGYQLKDCISFGDGMNDQEMLAMAGKGCIMQNAQQRLKDTLPTLDVIGSNEDDAVPDIYGRCIWERNKKCFTTTTTNDYHCHACRPLRYWHGSTTLLTLLPVISANLCAGFFLIPSLALCRPSFDFFELSGDIFPLLFCCVAHRLEENSEEN